MDSDSAVNVVKYGGQVFITDEQREEAEQNGGYLYFSLGHSSEEDDELAT